MTDTGGSGPLDPGRNRDHDPTDVRRVTDQAREAAAAARAAGDPRLAAYERDIAAVGAQWLAAYDTRGREL